MPHTEKCIVHAPSVHFLLNVACTKMLSCVSIVFHIPPSCCPGTEVFSKARPFRKGKQFQHLFLSSITQIVVMGPTPPLAINIISYALQSGGLPDYIGMYLYLYDDVPSSPLDNTNIIVHSLWRATTELLFSTINIWQGPVSYNIIVCSIR